MDTVRALSRINFVVFSQLVGVELPRGVASMFVVPCKIGYRNQFRYHLLYFFLLIPCETCCHESSKKKCFLFTGRNGSVCSWVCWQTWPAPHNPHPLRCSLYWQCLESQVVHSTCAKHTQKHTANHTP